MATKLFDELAAERDKLFAELDQDDELRTLKTRGKSVKPRRPPQEHPDPDGGLYGSHYEELGWEPGDS